MSDPQGATFLSATQGLHGALSVPGDKSISHRAVLLGAVNSRPLTITGFLRSADTMATVAAVQSLGVSVEDQGEGLVVGGRGWAGLSEPGNILDVANAGTLIRLLPGILASLPFLTVLTGDASIRRRPMARIVEPLKAMGATVMARKGNTLPPLAIFGGPLRGITHHMPVASAQVKSCVLLAGLRASGVTSVVEPGVSRDHTERLLRFGGARVEREDAADGSGTVRVWPVDRLTLSDIAVPGDFSSAAFFIFAALLVDGSEITIDNVGLNPTRTALLEVLEGMGAHIQVQPSAAIGPEPVGRITVRSTELQAVEVGPRLVPNLIDELPLFLLAAAKARGVSRLRGAAELRAKESDRLSAMADVLRALGVSVVEHPDGMDIEGRPQGWRGGAISARGDHRISMVGAIAGLASDDGVHVDDIDCAAVSYPGFVDAVGRLGGSVRHDEVSR